MAESSMRARPRYGGDAAERPRGPTGYSPGRVVQLGLRFTAVVYLVGSGVHIGMAARGGELYRDFAQAALPPVRTAWDEVFMAEPRGWALAVAAGELLIGLLLLAGASAADAGAAGARAGRAGLAGKAGLAGAIVFHLCLLAFGWWVWAYAVPALIGLGWLAGRVAGITGGAIERVA